MNPILLYTILFISLNQPVLSIPFRPLSLFSKEEEISVFDAITTAVSNLINDVLHNESLIISTKCKETLTQAYVKKEANSFYLRKLFSDSSKNDNDISSYSECIRKPKGTKMFKEIKYPFDMNYLVSIIESNLFEDKDYESTSIISILFGVCGVMNCNDTEYQIVFNTTNYYLGYLFNLTNSSLIVLSLSENDPDYNLINFVNLIPFYIVVFFLLCVIFNSIPFHLFKLCYREKNTRIKRANVSEISAEFILFPNKKLYELKASFNITENGEELYKSKSQQGEMNHDMGLTYIKGIRGLSMLLLIFGFFFFALFNSPIAVKGERTFSLFVSRIGFSIFFFGLRFSPIILFSCSGYCLFYKFISYLDAKTEEIQELRRQKAENEKNQENSIDNLGNNQDANVSLSQQLESANSETFTKTHEDVPFSLLGYFYLYQIHKYILYVIVILFMKYSLFYVALFFKSIGPMWLYFNKRILQNTWKVSNLPTYELLKTIGLINGFLFNTMNRRSFLNYFWIAENEIIFFIITAFIIFLGYKFQFRSDRIFFFSIILLIIIKIIVYCYFAFATETMNAALYYYYLNYGIFSISPYYNIVYYFIGVYFSIINYSIQKGITYDEADRQLKPFLLVSVRYANLFKKQSKKALYIIGFFGFVGILFFSFFQSLALLISRISSGISIKETLNNFINNDGIKIYYFIDGDLLLLLIHCICLACYVKGDNLMNSFLSSSVWSMYNQFYFSFILLINPVILYLLYQSETRITFDFWNCIFYSLICEVLLIAIGSIIYICYEAPLKRMFRLMLRFKQNNNNDITYIDSRYEKTESVIKED